MKANEFVDALGALEFENTFNPYLHRCAIHDVADAPRRRTRALGAMLEAASTMEVEALWIGRDLGYRGGRRTGMALTDDVHMSAHAARWGVAIERPTKGATVAERTAAIIWSVLFRIDRPVFLWNVFPLHPHEPDDPFSNRSHNARERRAGEEILFELVLLLRPRRIVAIGNDAARAASRLLDDLEVAQVRHPSYGGQAEFMDQIRSLYCLADTQTVRRLL